MRREMERHRLAVLGINTPLGPEAEPGLAGVPGRERDFDALFRQALDYAVGIGAITIHCLSGQVPPERQADAAEVLTLMEEQDKSSLRLTDEQEAEVRRRLADPNPKFLTLEEVRERFARRGR